PARLRASIRWHNGRCGRQDGPYPAHCGRTGVAVPDLREPVRIGDREPRGRRGPVVAAAEPRSSATRSGVVMLLVVSVSTLWLLGMVAAAVHAQDAGRTGANALRMALAFAAAAPLAIWLA